jgi:hypothetical protein
VKAKPLAFDFVAPAFYESGHKQVPVATRKPQPWEAGMLKRA